MASQLAATVRRLLAVGCFLVLDKAFTASGVGAVLPPPLVGMFGLFGCLIYLDSVSTSAASLLFQSLQPGHKFMFKWAPLFLTPALVKLPLVEEPMSSGLVLRLLVLMIGGVALQMGFVGRVAKTLASQLARLTDDKLDMVDTTQALPAVTPIPHKAANGGHGVEAYPRPGRPFKRRWLPVRLSRT